jgi:hypothetical protein
VIGRRQRRQHHGADGESCCQHRSHLSVPPLLSKGYATRGSLAALAGAPGADCRPYCQGKSRQNSRRSSQTAGPSVLKSWPRVLRPHRSRPIAWLAHSLMFPTMHRLRMCGSARPPRVGLNAVKCALV